jgi:hypothetical protein
MRPEAPFDETLAQRLPLPLAQLYRRAHDAGSAVERHLAAFYLCEAGLKLLGCVAVIEYAARGDHDPAIDERLQNLARPALGHWREFVRLLVPRLARPATGTSPACATCSLTAGTTCLRPPAWMPCCGNNPAARPRPARPSASATCWTGW